jgi:tetratricopeptide (TPR) repeat protein
MAKAPKKSGKKASSKKAEAPQGPSAQSAHHAPPFLLNLKLQSILLFVFAFLLYANTLNHEFVLDDAIVISDNMYTQEGVQGIPGILSKDTFYGFFKEEGKDVLVSGGRYRPLTLVMFATVYQIAGPSTFAFHLLTVLLYAFTCLVLYRTLHTLFKPRLGDEQAALLSWIAALIFTAHPVHTEVVANIKGCDEIVTLLGSLSTLWLVLKAIDTKEMKWAWISGLVFFLACMSKENAATFVVVAPLAVWFFRPDALGGSTKGLTRYAMPLWVGFLVFFIIRGTILNWKFGDAPMEFMNNPFLKIENGMWVAASFAEKFATVLWTLMKYIQLLLVPHPLTHDYYPRYIPLMSFGNGVVLLSLAVHLGLAWYAIKGITKRDPVRFGILYYLLTLSIVSNLVFPIGTLMGERFLFMPSVGFAIVFAALVLRFIKNTQTALILTGIVAGLFAFKTVLRNPVWHDNETLFFADAATSSNSAKLQNACGGIRFDQAKKAPQGAERNRLFEEAFKYADQALDIYPTYKDALLTRGGSNLYLGRYDAAVADYREARRIAAKDPKMVQYLAIALRESGQYYGEKKQDMATAMKLLNESWSLNDQDAGTARLLGVANGMQQKSAEALKWFQKAAELAPEEASIHFDLGTTYYFMGDAVNGKKSYDRAIELDSSYAERARAMLAPR